MLAKLAVNPKTSGFLQQPDFMRMMQDINTHPDRMGNYLGDPRFQMALEVGVSVLERLLILAALHCILGPTMTQEVACQQPFRLWTCEKL